MKTWMIETPPGLEGARADAAQDSQWQSVKSDLVFVDSGSLVFYAYGSTKGEPDLILAPGTWLSCHAEKES